MVDTGTSLALIKGAHALDNVATEQVGDVLSQKEIELAYAEEKLLIRDKKMYVAISFSMAFHLKTILDNRWYKVLGHPSFESWTESPEIDIDRSSAFRYIHLYNAYLDNSAFTIEELQDIGVSKLEMMARYVKPDEVGWKEKKKDILQKLTLPRRELTKVLNGDTGEAPSLPTAKAPLASYEVLPDASTATKGHSSKGKDADEAFTKAHKSELPSSQVVPVIQPIDSKRLGISGWYELVPLEQEPTAKGKLVTGAMLSANKILVTGSKIFIDIE